MSKANAKKRSDDIWYKILAIVIAAIFVLGIVMSVVKSTGLVERISLHTNVAIKSENYSVSNASMTYLVYSMYNYYYNMYSQYGDASSFGFDASLPLSKQTYSGEQSWRDFLVESVTESMKDNLVICEAFKADESLSAEKRAEIEAEAKKETEAEIDALKDIAKENNVSAAKYISQMCFYTKGIAVSDVSDAIELQMLASKYSEYVRESYELNDADYDEKYNANKKDYQYADYKQYTITADYEDDATDAEKKAAQDKAKAAIEAIKKNIDDGMSFEDAVYKYEQELKAEEEKKDDADKKDTDDEAEDDKEEEEEEKTEEELKKEIADKVLKETQVYSDGELGKWIFESSTTPAVGELKIITSEDDNTLYQIVKQPYRLEYETKKFYYISISNGVATDDKKAEDVVADYLKEIEGKLTAGDEEGFKNLAEQYKDNESCTVTFYDSVGNLKKDTVDSSLSVEDFDDWAFGDSIKVGDIKSFSSESASYIFYFTGNGPIAWKDDVDNDIRDEKYEADEKGWAEKYKIDVNEKAQEKIAK